MKLSIKNSRWKMIMNNFYTIQRVSETQIYYQNITNHKLEFFSEKEKCLIFFFIKWWIPSASHFWRCQYFIPISSTYKPKKLLYSMFLVVNPLLINESQIWIYKKKMVRPPRFAVVIRPGAFIQFTPPPHQQKNVSHLLWIKVIT